VYKKLQRRQNIIGIITDSGNRKIVSLDRNILVILNIGSGVNEIMEKKC